MQSGAAKVINGVHVCAMLEKVFHHRQHGRDVAGEFEALSQVHQQRSTIVDGVCITPRINECLCGFNTSATCKMVMAVKQQTDWGFTVVGAHGVYIAPHAPQHADRRCIHADDCMFKRGESLALVAIEYDTVETHPASEGSA